MSDAPACEQLTPFQILNCAVSFDLPDLEGLALELQTRHHPDRFVHNPAQKSVAEAHFAQIVWAHEELRDLHKRAQWLLKAVGFWPPPSHPETLEMLMELEEAVRMGETTPSRLVDMIGEREHAVAQAFERQDWPKAAQHMMIAAGLKRMAGER